MNPLSLLLTSDYFRYQSFLKFRFEATKKSLGWLIKFVSSVSVRTYAVIRMPFFHVVTTFTPTNVDRSYLIFYTLLNMEKLVESFVQDQG